MAAGAQFLQVGHKSCFNRKCPTCFESWAWREAKRIAHRLSRYEGRRHRVIHCVASVPRNLWYMDPEKLRNRARSIAKTAGFEGGTVVYHPFRRACHICGAPREPHSRICPQCGSNQFGWHYSPHFHFLGFGWIFGEKKELEEVQRSGWVFVNFGVRESVVGTAFYELTHCAVYYGRTTRTEILRVDGSVSYGVSGRKSSVHWIGTMAYRACRIPEAEREIHYCPICHSELIPYVYRGVDLDLEHEPLPRGQHYLKPDGWEPRRQIVFSRG